MLDHHIQRAIVYKLALSTAFNFTDLKPDILDSKLFTYHLKKVVAAGYVEKQQNGAYALTPEGRRLGINVLENTQALIDRAYSVLFLIVRNESNDKWLLYKRKNHPLINKIGFMHSTPNATESVLETAQRELHEHTGLTADFTSLGGGYLRIKDGQNLESFTHYTLLVATNAAGELQQNNETAEYFWVDTIDLNDEDLIPNTSILINYYQAGKPFFAEDSIQI